MLSRKLQTDGKCLLFLTLLFQLENFFMSITRTDIFNFKSETECDKYIASHREFMKSLEIEGIQEIHWVRATPESLLIFSILKSKEDADVIKSKANEWREKYKFNIHDMLVFDGELIESLKK